MDLVLVFFVPSSLPLYPLCLYLLLFLGIEPLNDSRCIGVAFCEYGVNSGTPLAISSLASFSANILLSTPKLGVLALVLGILDRLYLALEGFFVLLLDQRFCLIRMNLSSSNLAGGSAMSASFIAIRQKVLVGGATYRKIRSHSLMCR